MNIVYNDLCIRNATKEDSIQLASWWNDGKVMAHAGLPKGLGTTPEEVEAQIANDSDTTRRRLMIEYRKTAIGEMSYYSQGNQVVEIGIKICDTSYQEKGLGRIILSLLIRELFAMGFEKVILDTNQKNTRAQHVYELLGFEKVKVRVDSWRNQLGELQTSIDYELGASSFVDWTKNQ